MMDLVLNLGWLALAMAMCWLWVRYGRPEGRRLSAQCICLVLVLLMMFVAITTYDDMAMAQSPAEARCFLRDDRFSVHAHASLHPALAPVPTFAAGIPFHTIRFVEPGRPLIAAGRVPALSSIQNRPPPVA